MTIVEFLTARLNEDEAWASAALGWQTGSRHEDQPLDWSIHMRRWSPDNVLAEVEAKRRIVALLVGSGHGMDRGAYGLPGAAWDVIAHLASAYDQHPDFDPAWRADA